MTEGPADGPVNAFVVEDEPMGDGRTIHYYVWPASTEDRPPSGAPAAATTPSPEPDPDV